MWPALSLRANSRITSYYECLHRQWRWGTKIKIGVTRFIKSRNFRIRPIDQAEISAKNRRMLAWLNW